MKIKQFFIQNYLLILIIFFAAILRLWALPQIPASLNIDEQALGYNAYSLFKTGLDEHGKFFPISLESFGDWKLIGYPLVTIPFIAIFGLSDVSTRLPSVLAGIIQVFLLYYFTLTFLKNKKIALFSALLLALSPWGIYFSRMAYEVNVATTYFLGGLLAYLSYIKNKKRVGLFVIACILFTATLFTYHAFVIFTPLFCISLFLWKRKDLQKNIFIYAGLAIFILACIFVMKSVITSSSGKLSDLVVWHDQNTIYNRSDIFRTDGSQDTKLGKIFYSRGFVVAYQIGQNYLATFSPSFLFDKGGQKLVNSLGYFGNFYLFDSVLFILGIIFIASTKIQNKSMLLFWLMLGILPSAITQDAPSATRLFLLLPLLIFTSSCGVLYLLQLMQQYKLLGKLLFFCFFLIYGVNVLFFFDAYYLHINYQRALYLHYGYKQAVQLTQKYPQDKIVMVGPENFPYISFLFYTQYDPTKFRKEVVYYPKNHGVFIEVKQFGRYSFVDSIDYAHLQSKTLYIDNKSFNNKVEEIFLPNGQPIFQYFVK